LRWQHRPLRVVDVGPAVAIAHRRGLKARAVALTFDDGPSEWTEPILDTLREADGRATFFVIGDAISGREETLRRVVADGHEVANHTATHARLDQLTSATDIERELQLGTQAIRDATGTSPVLFRPPGFHYTAPVLDVAGTCGLPWVVLADVALADYNMTSPKKIARKVLRRVRRGSIIALHDGRPPHEPPPDAGGSLEDRSACVGAVRLVVPTLVDRGYELCTVSELLAM
jgi:peptidoglycan/xylan/chitin deacetylase (PgdA/CDA1 family)